VSTPLERMRARQDGDYEVPVLREPDNPDAPIPVSDPAEDQPAD
jgi:hypothetical protein